MVGVYHVPLGDRGALVIEIVTVRRAGVSCLCGPKARRLDIVGNCVLKIRNVREAYVWVTPKVCVAVLAGLLSNALMGGCVCSTKGRDHVDPTAVSKDVEAKIAVTLTLGCVELGAVVAIRVGGESHVRTVDVFGPMEPV